MNPITEFNHLVYSLMTVKAILKHLNEGEHV